MSIEIGLLAFIFLVIAVALYVALKRIYILGEYFLGISYALLILFLGLVVRVVAAAYFSPVPFSLFVVPQYLAWSAFLFMPLLLFGIAWIERREMPSVALISSIAGMGLIFIAAYAFLIEPYNFEVSHYEIASSKITEPIRIGVLSDIQTDNPGGYEKRIFETLASENPDLIIMTGDYVQIRGTSEEYREAMRTLLSLMNEAGLEDVPAYAVQGDVERGSEWNFVMQSFSGLNIRAIGMTNRTSVGEVELRGLSFSDSYDNSLEIAGTDNFHIVFGHRPDFALGDVDADLLLAGHVHGGQVQLPFVGPLITITRVPKSWVNGSLIELAENKHLVISRGIGMERGDAPRMRFLCRPQLVMIDLLPES